MNEMTFRSIVLAVILTAILAASNVYLALKLGNTIAASIPAAVLAMGVLKFFRGSSILESNLVQTSASAGEGVAAAVSFILPALIITGFWQHFYYWQTVIIILLGGMLGVFFSIPLRRLLINHKDLIFPEGTAVGNVLKASETKASNYKLLLSGILTGATISLFQTGFKIISDSWQLWSMRGRVLFGLSLGFSPALLAAGFIVGMQASVGMLVGFIIGWLIGIPFLSTFYTPPLNVAPYDFAMQLWNQEIRFVGVGTMILGGAWTLLLLLKPIYQSLKLSFSSMNVLNGETKSRVLGQTDDLPMKLILWSVILLIGLVFIAMFYLLSSEKILLALSTRFFLSLFGTLFIVIAGFFLASVCAYLSGLIGMTNNPLSGLMLISVLIISLLLSLIMFTTPNKLGDQINFVVLVTAMTAIISAISGENMQDLKAGQIVGAAPWKQQIMIMVGVITASLVVAPVLELLFQAYGIGGVFPRPHMDHAQMLPAPQAGLMTAVAEGVFGKSLPWKAIIAGIIVAAVAIMIDECVKRYNKRLPVLAIGLGIYLPPDIIIPVVIGGFISCAVKKRFGECNKGTHNSTLLACGLVAGSALMGVILAVPFVLAGNSDALRLMTNTLVANILGIAMIFLLSAWLYFTASSVNKN